jgi:hypothetical protein
MVGGAANTEHHHEDHRCPALAASCLCACAEQGQPRSGGTVAVTMTEEGFQAIMTVATFKIETGQTAAGEPAKKALSDLGKAYSALLVGRSLVDAAYAASGAAIPQTVSDDRFDVDRAYVMLRDRLQSLAEGVPIK